MSTGKVFLGYCRGRPRWVTRETFEKYAACARKKAAEWAKNNKEQNNRKWSEWRARNREKVANCNRKNARKYWLKRRDEYAHMTREIRKQFPHKRGFVDVSTGLVFWDISGGKIRWITPEKYNEWKEKSNRNQAKWVARNRDRVSQTKSSWVKRQRSNPIFRISMSLRQRVRAAIKGRGGSGVGVVEKLIGCTIKFFCLYIEDGWLPGMSWDNYGVYKRGGPPKWSLDHVFPLSRATSLEHLISLSKYTNIRPMWGYDNSSKSNRLTSPVSALTEDRKP